MPNVALLVVGHGKPSSEALISFQNRINRYRYHTAVKKSLKTTLTNSFNNYNKQIVFRGLTIKGPKSNSANDLMPNHHSVILPVNRTHRVKTVDYVTNQSSDLIGPRIIDVDVSSVPIVLHFKSYSSPIKVKQIHRPSIAEQIETTDEDAPQIIRHLVTKPIIQEIREIITPYRRIIQDIQPVQEVVHTIVATNNKKHRPSQQSKDVNGYS